MIAGSGFGAGFTFGEEIESVTKALPVVVNGPSTASGLPSSSPRTILPAVFAVVPGSTSAMLRLASLAWLAPLPRRAEPLPVTLINPKLPVAETFAPILNLSATELSAPGTR